MKSVTWKVFINDSPVVVYRYLSMDRLRESFWAEKSNSTGHGFELTFPNGQSTSCRILLAEPYQHLAIEYFNSRVDFELKPINDGTELTVVNTNILESEYEDVLAGWVSVLLCLKVAIQFKKDIRNHNPARCWDQGFVDN